MLLPGDTLGRYSIEAVLGEGGMGRVYRALDTRLDRHVALKVLGGDTEASGDRRSEAVARLLREARAAAVLTHPNVMAIYDVGEVDGVPYIAMELVTGRTLRALVGDPSVGWNRRVRWLVDVARALASAHAAGLVHRDVKPENVMVREDDTIKLLDFGVARSAAGKVDVTGPTQRPQLASLTGAGIAVGTPVYMAPEQMRGAAVDGRADQFAWGVLAYELLAGKPPWPSCPDVLATIASILSEPPPPLRELTGQRLPSAVEWVIRKALGRTPSERFASMDDIVVQLDPVCRPPGAPMVPVSMAESPELRASSTQDSGRLGKGAEIARLDVAGMELTGETLHDSPWKLRALFTDGLIGASVNEIVHDAAGRAVDFVVRDADEAFHEILGVEARGQSITAIFPGIERERFDWIGTFDEVARGGAAIRFEQYFAPNGRWYDFVAYQPQPGFFVLCLKDVSGQKKIEAERAKLEAQLQQAQKLESVGRLASAMAHDFNNMLSVVVSNAQLALQQVAESQPIHADLVEICAAAERSAELIRRLLAFANSQTVAPQALDLNEAVARTLEMLGRLVGEGIEVVWRPAAQLWPIKSDRSQLEQVLANLCLNARDAIANVGTIEIDTSNCVVDEAYCATHAGARPGEYVRLAVRDDGCGMDPETRARLFEPLFTTKAPGKGTGLALTTVADIVKQNGGFISVRSEPGKGSRFALHFPRHVPEADQARSSGTMPASRPNETILVVEDEPAILKVTKRILEGLGYTVLQAGSPGEAMRICREYAGHIQLLLTDVIMPEMNGWDLAKNLLTIYPRMKCLFMSGYTANAIAAGDEVAKGVPLIAKPFSNQELATKVRQLLDGAISAKT